MRRRIAWAQVGLLAVAALSAGLAFDDVFESSRLVVPVVAAVVVPLLVGLALRLRGRAHLSVAVLAYAVGFPVGWLLAAPPGGGDLATLRDGLANGWAGILAASVPVPERPALFVVPFAVVFVATAVAFEIVARTRRCVMSAVPPLAAAAVAFALGESGPRSNAIVTTGLVVGAAGLVLVRARAFTTDPKPFDRRATERLVVDAPSAPTGPIPAIAVVLAAIMVALGLASVLPPLASGRAHELHDDRRIPERRVVEMNPLGYADQGADDGDHLFTVTLDAPVDGCSTDTPTRCPRFPVAVLDHFDGAAWTGSSRYVTAGSRLPATGVPEGASTPASTRVVQEVVVERLPDSQVLPALDRPERITDFTGRGIQFDKATGLLRLVDGPARDLSYTVQSARPVVDPAWLRNAAVATDDTARAAVQPLALPPNLAAVKDQVTGKASTPFQQLALLSHFFTAVDSGFTVDEDPESKVPAGYSMQRLDRLVADPRAPGAKKFARVGSRGQYAAAFTAIAKAIGFPARLVVGYSAAPRRDGRTVVIRAGDLVAWPEVALAGAGWVSFNPDPSLSSSANEQELEEQPLEDEIDKSVDEAERNPGASRRPGENPNLAPAAARNGRTAWIWFAVAGSAAVLLVLSPVVVKAARRRRRRRRGDPGRRVAAAWDDALDPLVEAGVDRTHTLTTRTAADEAAVRFGVPAAGSLAALGATVDRALHADEAPTASDADAAWRSADRFRADVRRSLPLARRIRSHVDPRSLVPRGRSRGSAPRGTRDRSGRRAVRR